MENSHILAQTIGLLHIAAAGTAVATTKGCYFLGDLPMLAIVYYNGVLLQNYTPFPSLIKGLQCICPICGS